MVRRWHRQTNAHVCNFHSYLFGICGLVLGIFMIFIKQMTIFIPNNYLLSYALYPLSLGKEVWIDQGPFGR